MLAFLAGLTIGILAAAVYVAWCDTRALVGDVEAEYAHWKKGGWR